MQAKKAIIASLLILLAGATIAQFGSRFELKYRGSYSDIKIAKDNINALRVELNQASAADISSNEEQFENLINSDLPLQFKMVETAISKELSSTDINLSSLRPEQLQELRSTINATSPDSVAQFEAMVSGENFALYITLSMKDISAKGYDLLESIDRGSSDRIQIAKSELSLALARFDILTAYLVIGIENGSRDL
ncbi:MAG: hypothetical protein O9309_13650 [Rhizobium sp.]|nr:hypothetical protein [Rhizobium sp.]MCZ8350101.1 hypothetical protein [Rhizobium sp.]